MNDEIPWREVYGGPLDGDRISAELGPDLLVTVQKPERAKIDATGLTKDGTIPMVRCWVVKREKLAKMKVPVHHYDVCGQGHYHHAGVQ